MFSRSNTAIGLALLASLMVTISVYAGGWAVITLDNLPTDVVAGEPLTIGFTVLQHGKTPMADLQPTITANLHEDSQFVVKAEPEGKTGHYSATLTFPKEGDWNWSIQAFTMDQPLPVLSVAAPAAEVTSQPIPVSEPVSLRISPLIIVRVAALGFGLFGLIIVFRRKSRLAAALTAICLLIEVGTFVTIPVVPAVEAQSQSSPTEGVDGKPVSQVELGEQLFVAKGCVTCHTNNKVAQASEYRGFDVGAPNLTKFSAAPEYLRLWLQDPASVKPDTWMPNLNLSDAEIEALIAFINAE